MSYICLIVGNNTAVAASDSRLTQTNKYIPITIHTDHRKKVWKSKNGRMVWALCGITKNGISDYAKKISVFLADDTVPVCDRLNMFKKKAPLFTEKFKKRFGGDAVIEFLYAYKADSGDIISGRMTIQNGVQVKDEVYIGPCAMHAGANAAFLSDINEYIPKPAYSKRKLCKMARMRVSESVNYDKKMKLLNKKYKATVGGRVQLVTLD